MSTKDELLTSVLSLPAEERAEVARELLRSLDDPDESGDTESEWSRELDRRATDIREGRVETVSWDTAEQQIAGRLRHRR
ncbi:addiction module protein [Myxococcus landrumensis]|uniref:Addiction module protein n=1 Tax=Myxococcus landrumensis TaxID=2813577 RepID=A0ABX7N3L0_9BACT|nr:addiction module protein [Myxococcus landrumus]QSQ13305.1 addiction module protein [Myxococcus landrumus]